MTSAAAPRKPCKGDPMTFWRARCPELDAAFSNSALGGGAGSGRGMWLPCFNCGKYLLFLRCRSPLGDDFCSQKREPEKRSGLLRV